MTEQPTVLNLDALTRVLAQHQEIHPDPEDPPRGPTSPSGRYPGGSMCGCSRPIGPLTDGYTALARHQAQMIGARSDVIVVTETKPKPIEESPKAKANTEASTGWLKIPIGMHIVAVSSNGDEVSGNVTRLTERRGLITRIMVQQDDGPQRRIDLPDWRLKAVNGKPY